MMCPDRRHTAPHTLPAALTGHGSQLAAPSLSPPPAPLSQDALDGLMLEGENIVVAARKAIIRHDFSAVLTVFPILRHLKQTKPEFDQVLQVRGGRGALGDAGRRSPAAQQGLSGELHSLLRVRGSSSFPGALGGWRCSWGSEEKRQSPGRGAGKEQGSGALCSHVATSSGHGRQHQEQAAQPHHLHGDRGSQSAGGLCRQHQGALPLSTPPRPAGGAAGRATATGLRNS